MYCKVSTDVTETIADVFQDLYTSHKDITAQVNQSECFASSQQNSQPIPWSFASSKRTSQRQSPMYCKIWTDVTKTIDNVLQDLYRSHKGTRTHKDTSHKSQVNQWECCASLLMVVTKSSPQDTVCKIITNIHLTDVFKQFGNKLTFLSYLHVKMG